MNAQIEQIQPDIFAKLQAEPFFATICLFQIRKHRYLDEINEALSSATFDATQAGKLPGVTIEVLMPMIKTNLINAPGPVVTLEQRLTVKENPELNMAPGGVGLTAEAVAVQILQTLHQFYLAGICQALYPAAQAIVANPDFPGLVAYDVIVQATFNLTAPLRTAMPKLTSAPDGDTGVYIITLTDLEPGGSAIYTTYDGTFPSPKNGALYAEPALIDSTEPSVFRYAAYKDGKLGSSVGLANITPDS